MSTQAEKIVDLQNILSQRIKEYEIATDQYPPINVLNELRYALRGTVEIIDVLKEHETNPVIKEEISESEQKVLHALTCAYHDLLDGLLINVTITLDKLREEYGKEFIAILGPSRNEILIIINETSEEIARSRSEVGNRRDIYQDLYDKRFSELLDIKKKLDHSLIPEVITLRSKKESARKNVYRIGFSISFGIVCLYFFGVELALVGIISGALVGDWLGRSK